MTRLRPLTVAVVLAASSLASPSARAADPPAATTTLASEASTEPAPSPDEIPALVIGAVGLAAVVSGAVFGVLAWQDHDDFLSNPTTDTANRGQLNAFMADMCFAGGASLAIVSAVMFLRPEPEQSPGAPPPPAPKPRVSLSTFASGRGGGAAAVIRW